MSTAAPSKRAIVDALIDDTSRALDVMVQAAHTAHAAATHEEMKPENDKDTRGIEAGYLAAGQSARAAELQRTVQGLRGLVLRSFAPDDVVGPTALVSLSSGALVLISPFGGGTKVVVDGVEVQVVSVHAPLGAALLEKGVGDVVEVPRGRRVSIVALW